MVMDVDPDTSSKATPGAVSVPAASSDTSRAVTVTKGSASDASRIVVICRALDWRRSTHSCSTAAATRAIGGQIDHSSTMVETEQDCKVTKRRFKQGGCRREHGKVSNTGTEHDLPVERPRQGNP